jgi:putative ABC transport system permease protein
MYQITLLDIALGFIPVLITLIIIWQWSHSPKSALIAVLRMLIQLLLIGYVLNFIFNANSQWIILLALMFMLVAASWISLNTLPVDPKPLFIYSFAAIFCGGGLTLVFISQWVLHSDPWYQPQVMIPIAGMIFSNAMNAISLAGERLYSELGHDVDYHRARNIAFKAAMIPVTNALLAVGLVSLPGMMTGQILAGTSPLIASRYQIIVMCMIFSSAGISTAVFLTLLKRRSAVQEQ